MQTKKMSLANMQGKLSRMEMKNVLGGMNEGGNNCSNGSVISGPYDPQCTGGGTYVCGTRTPPGEAMLCDYCCCEGGRAIACDTQCAI